MAADFKVFAPAPLLLALLPSPIGSYHNLSDSSSHAPSALRLVEIFIFLKFKSKMKHWPATARVLYVGALVISPTICAERLTRRCFEHEMSGMIPPLLSCHNNLLVRCSHAPSDPRLSIIFKFEFACGLLGRYCSSGLSHLNSVSQEWHHGYGSSRAGSRRGRKLEGNLSGFY